MLWALMCLSFNVQAQGTKKEKLSSRERLINECYMMADSCLNCDNYSDAIMYASKGVGEIKNIWKFKELYYDLKMVEVKSYMHMNDYSTALSVLLNLEKKSSGPWHLANLYYCEFSCYESLKDWEQAILTSQKCLNIIEKWDEVAELILEVKLGLARSYARNHQYDISNKSYAEALEYAKQNCNEQTYVYCCSEICDELSHVGYSDLVIGAISELIRFYEKNNYIDEVYCELLRLKGKNAREVGDVQLYYDSCQQALEIYKSLADIQYDEEYSLEFEILSDNALAAAKLNKFDEAYAYCDKAEKTLLGLSDSLFLSYKDDLLLLRADIISTEGIRTMEAIEIYKDLLKSEKANRSSVFKGNVYSNLGETLEFYNMDEALAAYNAALPLIQEHYGAGVYYAKTLRNIAIILCQKGSEKVAIDYFELAINIFRRLSESENYSLVLTLCNAAKCAYSLGEIGRSIAWAEEARHIQNTTSIGIVDLSTWSLLLEAYKRVGNIDSYQSVYNEYRSVSDNGILKVDFAERELERLCIAGKIEDAIEYSNMLYTKYPSLDTLKKYNINVDKFLTPDHNFLFDFCMSSWQTNDYDWAMNLCAIELLEHREFTSANELFKSNFEKYQYDYQFLANSFWCSSHCGDYAHSEVVINRIVQLFREQMKSVLGLSLSEKTHYWGELSYLKNVLGAFLGETSIRKHLFDISLITKNFLVNSEVNFLKTLEHSGNEDVKSDIRDLRLTRELLASSMNNNVDSLKLREIEINRQIIRNLKTLSDFEYATNLCCDSIARALLPNEVAIEISDYSNGLIKNYVAMILRREWKEPILIELGEEAQFTSILNKPLTKKQLYDPFLPSSTKLYELIWKPIIPYLNRSDIIYISPSGVLSTIAIEVLSSDDGVYVSDIYDIKRVSSTAYVLERESECDFNSFCVFGGAQYDSEVNLSYSTDGSTWDSGYLLDRAIYEDIPYLPGTKKEAEMISKIITRSKGNVLLHLGSEANENAFKELSGNATEIIHIATHGFYIPKNDTSSYQYYIDNPGSVAMERSGLILAGANDAWNGKLIPGVEDGILTASEIAKLDLSKTSLVVMSACETGLGEVTEDGIEGLQRAFKSAGVETLVMSLWKVDDKATEMLMEEFYKLLLKGYSKDDAFQSAKTKVRSKKSYSSPYYWASFIMLD